MHILNMYCHSSKMLFITTEGKKQFHSNVLEYLQSGNNDELISKLQKVDLDDVVDYWGTTLLHLAALYGNDRITKYLEQSACDIDVQDNAGMTPLMIAVLYRQFNQVQLLLKLKADMRIKNYSGKSALSIALESINTDSRFTAIFLETLKDLEDHQRILRILKEANCKLYHAVYMKDPEIIKLLISSGCPVNEQNRSTGNTALLTSAFLGYKLIIDTLLQHGADATIKNYAEYSPFMFSLCHSWGKQKEEIKALCNGVSCWTDKNEQNGKLKLHPILVGGERQVVALFLKSYNIDFEAKDVHGMTPLHYLVENTYIEAIENLQDVELNVNMQDRSGRTPLHIAVLRMSWGIVEFLLKKGANANIKDDQGRTPLFYVFIEDSERPDNNYPGLRIISSLLEYSADPEIILNDNTTIITSGLQDRNFIDLLKPIVSHLTMFEVLGKPIYQTIREQITTDVFLNIHYETCYSQLQKMKENRIDSTVTLFNILTDTEKKLEDYAAKRENLIKIVNTNLEDVSDSYYQYILQKKFEKIIKFGGLKGAYEKVE